MLRRVAIAGGELACEVSGAGPPIVFLHGGLLDRTTWDAEAAALSASSTVVRYDARGHGESSPANGGYSHAEDLAALLDALEVERAVLCGLSLGGRTAIDFALTWPGRTRALVLCAPGVSGMDFTPDAFLAEQGGEQEAAIADRDAPRYVEAFLRMWVDGPRRQPADIGPEVRERCRAIAMRTLSNQAASTGTMRELHAISRLGELAMPILAFEGGQDSPLIARVLDTLTAARPDARRVVVSGAGHMVNLEEPDAFLAAMRAFLETLPD